MIVSILDPKHGVTTPAGLAKEIAYQFGVNVAGQIPSIYSALTEKNLTQKELEKVNDQYFKICERVKKYLKIEEH